jgi:hypothetical protein
VGSTLVGTTSFDDTAIDTSVFYYYKVTAYQDSYESDLDACRPAGPVWMCWGHWDDGEEDLSCGLYDGTGGWAVTFHSAASVRVTKVRVSVLPDSAAYAFRIGVWGAGWALVYSSDPIFADSSGWLEHEVTSPPSVGPGTFAVGVWLPTTSDSRPDWYFGLDSDFSGSQPPRGEFNDESWVNDGEGWQKLSAVLCEAELMFGCYIKPPGAAPAGAGLGSQQVAFLQREAGQQPEWGGAHSLSTNGRDVRSVGRARLVLSGVGG